jgi:hypothetical protein
MRVVFVLAVYILVAQAPRHEDCLPYNPQTVRIEPQASGWWSLVDSHQRMQAFGTEKDAQNGLALASRYSEQCFIGRHPSRRPSVTVRERRRYIVVYWKGPTGKQTIISPETCQPYVGSALRAEDRGAAGWLVTDGKNFHMPVDNSTDAKGLITLAHLYTTHCTIGSSNLPFPAGRVDYWK